MNFIWLTQCPFSWDFMNQNSKAGVLGGVDGSKSSDNTPLQFFHRYMSGEPQILSKLFVYIYVSHTVILLTNGT